jgi:hypothetical protein
MASQVVLQDENVLLEQLAKKIRQRLSLQRGKTCDLAGHHVESACKTQLLTRPKLKIEVVPFRDMWYLNTQFPLTHELKGIGYLDTTYLHGQQTQFVAFSNISSLNPPPSLNQPEPPPWWLVLTSQERGTMGGLWCTVCTL